MILSMLILDTLKYHLEELINKNKYLTLISVIFWGIFSPKVLDVTISRLLKQFFKAMQ